MISRGIKKYLVNPSLGLLIGVLFLGLFYFTDNIIYSFIISIVCSVLFDFLLRVCVKSRVCGLVFLINLCALIGTLSIWFFFCKSTFSDLFYLVVYEILLVCLMFLANLSKAYIILFFGKKQSTVQKTYLNEFFEISLLTQYGITFHLFMLLIYRYVTIDSGQSDWLGVLFHFLMPVAVFVFIIVYEEIKMRNIVKLLRKEEWLPIVSESGEVTGRIARSVSVKMKNKHLHPVVRVALVHNGHIYLQKRPDDVVIDPSMYDHPFEKYMLFNQEINATVNDAITKALDMHELPFNFLLKYVYETEKTKRLIFLFISRIETDEQMDSLNHLNGKFWTMKQIEDSFSDSDLFSECFQLEYEYLKNTVLQPEILKKGNSNNSDN